jgi:hypothetical protein
MKRFVRLGLLAPAVALLMGGRPARAQQEAYPTTPAVPQGEVQVRPARWQPISGFGGAALLGGGGFGFLDSRARSALDVGGSWDFRTVWGTRRTFGGELAYVGSTQGINLAGISTNERLLRNGIEGTLRLNLPLDVGPTLMEPFAFGGVGWNIYRPQDVGVVTTINGRDDNQLVVPAGAGLEVGYHGLIADVRFTWRPAYYTSLFNAPGTSMDSWNAQLSIGGEF